MIAKQFQKPEFRLIQIQPGTKAPIALKDWANKGLPFDDPKIIEWIAADKPIGIISGFGGLSAVDDDTTEGDIAKVCENALPPTYAERTGSGKVRHFYIIEGYDDPRDYIKLGIGEKDMGELRFRDSQCLIAPSLHPSGKRYEPANDKPIANITWARLKEIFSPWMVAKAPEIDPTADNKGLSEERLAEVLKANKKLMDGSTAGFKSRSEAEMSLITKLGIAGLSKAQVCAVMPGCKIGKWQEANNKYKELTLNKAFTTAKKQQTIRVLSDAENKREQTVDRSVWNDYFTTDNRGNLCFVPKRLGDDILKNKQFKTIKGNNRMYVYENGVYKENGGQVIQTICKQKLDEKYTSGRVRETISYIEACTFVEISEIHTVWINFSNGLLNTETLEFRQHTPDVFTITQIPINYEPEKDCPIWKEKLKSKVDERTYNVVQEMFGYCFIPRQPHEVAFLLKGQKRTMKSTTLFVLSQLLGDENVTAMPLQQIAEDHFAMAYLFGIRANICADLDAAALKNTGQFMILTGGDKVTAGKKREHLVSYYPDSKLIFSCNVVPATSNKDLAFYRRWIILEFDKETPMEQIDSTMKAKLTAELPGILNWALEGMKRIKENGKLSYWLTPEQVRDVYEKASDSVNSYIFNRITTEDDENVMEKRLIYADYVDFCRENRLQKENPIKFGRDFLAYTGCGTCKSGKIPAYAGVAWKSREAKTRMNDYV